MTSTLQRLDNAQHEAFEAYALAYHIHKGRAACLRILWAGFEIAETAYNNEMARLWSEARNAA